MKLKQVLALMVLVVTMAAPFVSNAVTESDLSELTLDELYDLKQMVEKEIADKEQQDQKVKQVDGEYDYETPAIDVIGDDFISAEIKNGNLTVTFYLSSGWSNKSTRKSFYLDVEKICRAYLSTIEADKSFNGVDFFAMADFTDKYGNYVSSKAMSCTISRKTIEKINWENFNADRLAKTVDSEWVHRSLQGD